MFGRNSFIDGIKSALAAAGCDMDTFRSWQKMYEKVNRKKKDEEEKYVRCRNMIMCVKADGEKMEEMLTADTPPDSGEFARLLKELKQLQGSFDHEFLVSREDHEFHSTYDTIIRLGIKALETPEQSLLLQSEIENLLELLKENLEKKKELWQYLKKKDMRSFIRIRYGILGQTMNIPGKSGRKISSLVYIVARRLIGFN